MSTLKAEDGDASERELLVDDIQRIREVLHISGGADKLSSDEEGDEESEEEEEDEVREKGGESLIGSTSNNSQHQIASHLSPPNSKITIPVTVLRAGDVEEQSPLNTRQEHASAPAGNNAQQQCPDVVLLQQQADNNFLPPSNMSSDECTLTELQPVNCQPSTSVFSPGIPIASMSSLNVLNSFTNVTFISDPSTISVGYNDATWLTEADQYRGQNDVDEQGEEGGLFSEDDDENYEDIETRSQIQQCLSLNRDYQLAVLDELGRLELALAKNREKQLGLHQMRASKDEGRPEPHTLIKFGNPYFRDTGAVGPPDNIDSKLKRQNCQVGGYQSKQKSWNAKEKACLADGVKMQNLENKLSPVLQKIQKLELKKNKTNVDCQDLEVLKTESSRIKSIPKEKLAYDLEGIDWDRISNTYVPKRAGFQCRLQWCNFGHPDVNCTPWTKDEDKKLIQLAKNPQNTWVTIAQNLQTKRTPIHCYERYQRSLNKDLLKSKWTPEDDKLLLEVVHDVGLGNWPRVASFLEGRQGDQCMHRYTQTLQMVRKGKWTTDEDELLKKGIEKYGTAWNKVSDMVPGRSGPQCRERWVNALDPKVDKGVWTKAQDKKLLDNVEKFGKGNWSKIARAMENRTDNQCWRRWIVLRKDDFLYYRQNTLRKKRELVSNFTGRRQERPSLEPEDLDIPDVPVVKKQRGRVPLPPEVSRERRRLTRKKFREKKRAEKRRAEEEARKNTSREKQQVQQNETNENGEEELEGVEDGDKETVEEVKSPQNRKVGGNRTRVQQPHRVLINNKQLPKRQRVTEKQDKRHTEPAGGQKTVAVSGSLGPFSLLLQAFSIDIPTVLRAIQNTSTTSSTTPPSSGTNVTPGDQQQMQTSSAAGNQESQQTSSTTPPSSGTNVTPGDQQQIQTSSAAGNQGSQQTSSTTPPSSGTNVIPGDQQQMQTSRAAGNHESPQTSSTTPPSSGTNVTPGDQQQMQTGTADGNQESQQTSSTIPPSSGTNVIPGDQQQMQTSSAGGNQGSQQTSSTTPPSSGTNVIPGDQQQMQTSRAAENEEIPQTSSTTPPSSGTNVTPGDQQQMQTGSADGNQGSQQTSSTTPPSSGTNAILGDQQQMQTSSAAGNQESPQTSSTTPPSSGTNAILGDQQQMQTGSAAGNHESPQTSSTTPPSSGTNVTPGDQQQMKTSSAAGNQESQQTSSTTPPSSGTNVTPGDQQQMQTGSAAGNHESPQTSSTTPPSSGTNVIPEDQQQMKTSSAAETRESQQMQTEVSGDSAASQSSVNTVAEVRDDTSESQETQERAKASSGQDSLLLKDKVDESGGDQVTKHTNMGQTVGLQSRSEVNNNETLNTGRVEAGNNSTAATPTSVAASTTNQAPRRRATAIPPLPPCFTTLRTFKSLLQLRPQLQRIAAMLNPTPGCSTAGSQSHQPLSAACPVVSSGSLSNKMSGVTCEPRAESCDSNVASRKDSEAMSKSRDSETTLGEDHVVSPGYTRDIQPSTVVEAGKENENVITDNRLSTAGTQLVEQGLPITNDKTGPEKAKTIEATLSSTISSAQDGVVTDDRFSTGFAPMPKEGLQVPANDKTGPWKAKPSEPAGSVLVGNDKQAATKTNRERDTNSPSTSVTNNSRVPPAVKGTRSYRNSYEYKMLSSRFSGLFLWPALLSKIPVKFTSQIGPVFVQRHPPPTTRPAPEKTATRKRKNTKPIEAPRPKRKHPGLAAVRMATSASFATPAQQMCTVGQGSAIRKEAAVAAAQPDADPLLATSQLVSLSTSSTGKRRYNTRASKRKGVPAKRRIKVIESSSSSSEDDWFEVHGHQPIITQTARITRQTSAGKPTKVSRAISAKLTSTTATDQAESANQVASLSVIVISSDSTNESRPSLQDAQGDTAGLQSGAAANMNLSTKRSSNSNLSQSSSSKRKNPAPKKNRGARWRAMLPKVSADENDSY